MRHKFDNSKKIENRSYSRKSITSINVNVETLINSPNKSSRPVTTPN